MLVKLPNGIVDGGDLFNFAEIDELKGKQQNYLVDKDLVVGNIGHVPKILSDMIISLQTEEGLHYKAAKEEILEKLPSGDIETILIKIRENTYGPRFYHEAECVHCGHIHKDLRLDLDQLDIDYMSIEDLSKSKEIELPKSKLKMRLKPPYMKDLFKVVKLTVKQDHSLVTATIAIVVKAIGYPKKEGKKTIYEWKDGITSKEIDDIPVSDLDYLQEQIDGMKLQGTIDTDIQIDCSDCGKEFETKLNCYDPSFFVRTRGYKT